MGLGTDQAVWRNVSSDMGNHWRAHWQAHWQALPEGNHTSAPALTASADGAALQLLALGNDFKLYLKQSTDGGAHWSDAHAPSGQGWV